MVDPDSWQFGLLIYLLVGWFATSYVEKSSIENGGKRWSLLGFVFCLVLWLPLCIWGILTANRN